MAGVLSRTAPSSTAYFGGFAAEYLGVMFRLNTAIGIHLPTVPVLERGWGLGGRLGPREGSDIVD